MNKGFLKRSLRFQIITVVLIAIIVPTVGLLCNFLLSNYREKGILQDSIQRAKDTSEYIDKQFNSDIVESIRTAKDNEEDFAGVQNSLQGIALPFINTNRGVRIGFYVPGLNQNYTFGRFNKNATSSSQENSQNYFENNIKSQVLWSIKNKEDKIDTSQGAYGVLLRSTHYVVRNDEPVAVVWQEILLTDDVLVNRKIGSYIWFFVFAGVAVGVILTFLILKNMLENINRVLKGLEAMEKDLSVQIQPMNGEIGKIAKSINAMGQALADKEKLEERMRKSEKLVALGQLVSGVAHEIRNPLGIIRATVQIMEREFKNVEGINEYLQVVKEQSDRENRVIQELLDYARPSKARLSNMDINDVIESTLSFTRYYIQDKHIELEVKFQKLLQVLVDEEKMKQVIINLIINACDAMEEGGRLTIDTYEEREYVCIKFSDTGIGIDEAQIKNIFNPYFTTKAKGVGLGLTISYGIVEMHGGYIDVKSIKNKGSEFIIFLPKIREDRKGGRDS